jgi:hypothetical protein
MTRLTQRRIYCHEMRKIPEHFSLIGHSSSRLVTRRKP